MRRIGLLVLTLVMCLTTLAQSSETVEGDSVPWEIRKQSFIYNSARLFSDAQVAKMALYNLIAESPGNPALYDSLSLIYLQYNQYASAALVAEQSLRVNPGNLFATEVAGSSFDNLGIKDKAIPYYETLYLSDNDINILYKIAFLQMELQRFNEATTSADIIIESPDSEKSNVVFPSEDGKGQSVPLKVAAHRVKAMVEEAKGNDDEAKRLYLKTLEMFPGLQIVQSQLQALNKKED